MFDIERPIARQMNREMLLGSVAALFILGVIAASAVHFERMGKILKSRDVRYRMTGVITSQNYDAAERNGLLTPGAARTLRQWDDRQGTARELKWWKQSCGVGTEPCRFIFQAVRPRGNEFFEMTVRGATCWRIDHLPGYVP
jgi:hypothetical protein